MNRTKVAVGGVLAIQTALLLLVVFQLGSVLEVQVSNPVTEVEVTNPVTEVRVSEIEQVVQVAVPTDASLYGYCSRDGSGFRLAIISVTGGLEQTVAEGRYARGAAESIARYAAEYYGLAELDFGESSSHCSPLDGWG